MPNYAQTTIVGHLGRDPEIRHLQDGTSVASFSIATDSKAGGEVHTTWWNCSVFGKQADVLAQYVRKGDPLLVSGEPRLRDWQDRDGNKRQSLEIRVANFSFMKGKGDSASEGTSQPRQQPAQDQGGRSAPRQPAEAPAPSFDDDIPF